MSAVVKFSNDARWFIGGRAWYALTDRAAEKLRLTRVSELVDELADHGLDFTLRTANDRRFLAAALLAAATELEAEADPGQERERLLKQYLADLIEKLHQELAGDYPADPDDPA